MSDDEKPPSAEAVEMAHAAMERAQSGPILSVHPDRTVQIVAYALDAFAAAAVKRERQVTYAPDPLDPPGSGEAMLRVLGKSGVPALFVAQTVIEAAVAKVLARLTDDDVVEAVEEVINTDGTAEFQACRDALAAAREKLKGTS
jgi:hypothetical protein